VKSTDGAENRCQMYRIIADLWVDQMGRFGAQRGRGNVACPLHRKNKDKPSQKPEMPGNSINQEIWKEATGAEITRDTDGGRRVYINKYTSQLYRIDAFILMVMSERVASVTG